MFRIALAALAILAGTGGAIRAATERAALEVPVCQRTKSDARPYLRVVVRTRTQLRAHLARHADIVPARGACPRVAVTPTTAARIQLVSTGKTVVALRAPDAATGVSSGCPNVSRALVRSVLARPAAYFLNVTTRDYPAGAIRGTLGR